MNDEPGLQAINRRDGRGRWMPGQSGNGSGRRKGSVCLRSRVTRLLTPKTADRIVRSLLQAACEGDLGSTKLIIELTDSVDLAARVAALENLVNGNHNHQQDQFIETKVTTARLLEIIEWLRAQNDFPPAIQSRAT
jgi:hypothetical protein